MIQAAAYLHIHSLADFFLGNMTEVMLNKTYGSLKAINIGLEFEAVVVEQRNPDFTTAVWGLGCFLLETLGVSTETSLVQDLRSSRVRLHYHV